VKAKPENLASHILVPNPVVAASHPYTCEEICLICGLLGGGKSYLALEKFIWEELLRGRRSIVTNHKLLLNKLREVMQNFDRDGNEVRLRVRLLTDDEMKEFWLHRGRKDGVFWDAKDVQVVQKGERGEAAIRDYNLDHENARPAEGVLYVFDEAHFGLRARDWMSFGRTGEWYFNHIRKMNDTVVLCTPHPDQLDKYVRNLLQKVYVVRNGGKERFLRFFQGPKRIFWDCYLGPYQKTMQRECGGFFQIKPWLADCYDTASGAGIVGGGPADKDTKQKGLPFWTLPAVGVAVVVAMIFVPKLFAGGFHAWTGSMFGSVKPPAQTNVAAAVQRPVRGVPGIVGAPVVAPADLPSVATLIPATKKFYSVTTTSGKPGAWVTDSAGNSLFASEISADHNVCFVNGEKWIWSMRSTQMRMPTEATATKKRKGVNEK